jgi:uncharacterized protein
MHPLTELLIKTAGQVWHSLAANWPFLAVSAVVAALLKLSVDQVRLAAFLRRHQGAGVLAATAVAVTTPLCACGTTAVVLGLMAGSLPWAPIVAFLVASPLTSPQELIYSAGLFGWPFALALFGASIALGLLGGAAAHTLERRGWLANQARYRPIAGASGLVVPGEPFSPGTANPARRAGLWRRFLRETYLTGRRLLGLFLVFAFVGYLLNNLLPSAWVARLFGQGSLYGIPLAAILGVPFYLNSEASLPLVQGLLDLGMSPGAALAFLITGAGTSVGAVGGALTIARWRIVGLVVGTLWVGAVIAGYAYEIVRLAG